MLLPHHMMFPIPIFKYTHKQGKAVKLRLYIPELFSQRTLSTIPFFSFHRDIHIIYVMNLYILHSFGDSEMISPLNCKILLCNLIILCQFGCFFLFFFHPLFFTPSLSLSLLSFLYKFSFVCAHKYYFYYCPNKCVSSRCVCHFSYLIF